VVELCILQNADFEGPGALVDWAISRGFRFQVVKAFAGENLPKNFTHLAILGTPHSVHEIDSLPWLAKEAIFVEQALIEKKHVLGICFGAQLLSHLHGGIVSPGPYTEIGWHPSSGPNFFQWHQETFTVPGDFMAFGNSLAGYPTGFAKGRTIGVSGHPEITPELIEAYIGRCWDEGWFKTEKEKGRAKFVQPPSALRASAVHIEEAYRFFDAWAAL
jgi:GMP synthase-like glutamine amidotransferase